MMSKDTDLIFPHVYQLEASAGSGKTFNLAKRYIDLLSMKKDVHAAPADFKNILAITFTNEASGEMKSRILKRIKAIALKDKDLLDEYKIDLPSDDIVARMNAYVDEILSDYSRFYVKTIDSFMHSVMVASSLQLNLPPYKEIEDTSSDYIEFAFDQLTYEADNKRFNALLGTFIEDYLNVQEGVGWYPRKDLLDTITRLYRKQNEQGLKFAVKKFKKPISAFEEDIKKLLSDIFERIDVEQIKLRSKKFSVSLLDASGKDFFDELFKQVMGSTNTQTFEDREKVSAGLYKAWGKLKKLCAEAAQHYSFSAFRHSIEVFKAFEEYFDEFKRAKRVIFLDELNKIAGDFLRSDTFLPPELFYKLSAVFYHYLIDEFQDTNRLQWANIETLVAEALSRGGSLFYVGDKKQAIYRFRSGDIRLFDEVIEAFKGRTRTYSRVLDRNFRSLYNVVGFNNEVFSRDNIKKLFEEIQSSSTATALDEDLSVKILDTFADSRQVPVKGEQKDGFVKLKALEGGVGEEIDEQVKEELLALLGEVSKRRSLSDITILVRKNDESERVASWLISNGIPVYSARTISIRENFLIKEIMSFLKFLHSPIDDLSFVSFIMGEVFSHAAKVADLKAWVESERAERSSKAMYTRFRSQFPELWHGFIEYFFKNVGFLPLYEILDTILKKFKVFSEFPSQEAYFLHLLETAASLQEKGKNSIGDFLDDMYPEGENEDERPFYVKATPQTECVSIMTVHKAKGLENKVVIIPFVHFKPEVKNPVVCNDGENLWLLNIKKNYEVDPYLRDIYRQEYTMSVMDELNGLYVAFTRAEEELYVFVPKIKGRGANKVYTFLMGGEEEVSRGTVPEAIEGACDEDDIAPVDDGGGFSSQMMPELIEERISEEGLLSKREVSSYLQIKRGKVFHMVFSSIETLADIKKALPDIEVKVSAACAYFNYKDKQEILDMVVKALSNGEMASLFAAGYKVYNEKEVVDAFGNTRRMDRLMVGEDKVVVIDYKTGAACESDIKQISEYKGLLKEVFRNKDIKGYLYYIEADELHEV